MDPCKVCGGTDLNLVDGFYYCVECGTQDVNIQETVVEQTAIGDGTFAHATTKKFTTAVQDGVEMSGEWHKWHLFNFILAGLTDELIALGAKPSIKMKVLWVWTRYIKAFQTKEDSMSQKGEFDDDEDDEDGEEGEKEDSGNDDSESESNGKSKKSNQETFVTDVKLITKGTILTILYVALNLDRSDIQLHQLLRFAREGRLSILRFQKFVPKELNTKVIKNWRSFLYSTLVINPVTIRSQAMTLFKRLKLGVPSVPDLRKLVKNYVKELCLPSDFANLVFALMHCIPTDYLDIDYSTQKGLVRNPDYESVCMAYTLVALKMCFGLDGDYEVKLSREVDKINDEENYLKSYKLGMFAEPSDRLFSFKDWCKHLQFRRLMVCKYYLPMAEQFKCTPDDDVFIEHLDARRQREVKLSDEVTMDILNKIRSEEESQMIPKNKFPSTLTPMTCYVDVIAQYVRDPDLKLLLCEDFTQYSLKYAIQDLKLDSYLNNSENPIVGVSHTGKVLNRHVIGTLKNNAGDTSIVYVRNCQNKNWLKTKPPTVDHVTKESHDETSSDKDSDHGYDSNVENSNPETNATHLSISDSVCPEDKKNQTIEELDGDKSIFDDILIPLPSSNESQVTIKEERPDDGFEIDTQSNITIQDSQIQSKDNLENDDSEISYSFNSETFSRERMIEELIDLARKKYKISVPKEMAEREPRKRKVNFVKDEASSSEPKKKRSEKRAKPGEAKDAVNNLVSAYYSNLQNDILIQISEQVKSVIENVDKQLNDEIVDQPNAPTVTDAQSELNNSIYSSFIEEQQSQRELEHSTTQIDQEGVNAQNQNPDERVEEEEEEVLDEFLKSDPNFDEKDHDIKQLYVKIGDCDTSNDALDDILENVPDIDKIIQRNIEEISNIDKCAPETKNADDNIADKDYDSSESDDDVPLSVIKETRSIDLERLQRRKEKLEPLIQNSANVKEFNYWIRHYSAQCVVRSADMGQKFDVELFENLPVSFCFVIRECAALLGCSMFTIYKNLQNIEEILVYKEVSES